MRAIIVDDEYHARLALKGIIEQNFQQIKIVAECKNVIEAVDAIKKYIPELVFLDISMPEHSGLELFRFFEADTLNFKVIFVTAYQEYAINAFELAALDYILKPVKIESLKRAISKLEVMRPEQYLALKDNYQNHYSSKIALNTGSNITMLDMHDILYLKAAGSYTHFITHDDTVITVTKRISEYERLEKTGLFLRIHRSHIVNINHIHKILKKDGGSVEMINGDNLSISAEKKLLLMDRLTDRSF